MRHVATSAGIDTQENVVGLCSCGWVAMRPRHQYVYAQDGIEWASKELQRHIAAEAGDSQSPADGS